MLSQRLKSDCRFQLLLDSMDCCAKWLLSRSLPLSKLRGLSILLLVSTEKALNLSVQMMFRWWKKPSTGVGTSPGILGRICTRLVLWVHRLFFHSYLLLFLILSLPLEMAWWDYAFTPQGLKFPILNLVDSCRSHVHGWKDLSLPVSWHWLP